MIAISGAGGLDAMEAQMTLCYNYVQDYPVAPNRTVLP